MINIDLSRNSSPFSIANKLLRTIWTLVYFVFFSCLPNKGFNWIRVFALKALGAKIGRGSVVYSSSNIWCPWNLIMGEYSCLGPFTDIYTMDKVEIGNNVTISQNAVLCTGSHDIFSESMKLITNKIVIEDSAWVCAYAKVLPGVTIQEGSVVAMAAVLAKSTEPWFIYVGNPAVKLKSRTISKD